MLPVADLCFSLPGLGELICNTNDAFELYILYYSSTALSLFIWGDCLGCRAEHTWTNMKMTPVIPRLRRHRFSCSLKNLFFSFTRQPRWRLVVITLWWGWCPAGTISTVFPFSTDYWNTASSPRPERTVWITSALWNELLRIHIHTQSFVFLWLQQFDKCRYKYFWTFLPNILFIPDYVKFDVRIFIWVIILIHLNSWMMTDLIVLFCPLSRDFVVLDSLFLG